MKEKGRPGSRAVRIVLFFAYLVILIYLLFFAESFGRGISDDYRYNFVPFTEIRRYLTYWETIGIFGVLLNLVGNVAASMPFGYFLSALTDNRLKAISVLLFTMEFSILVEVIQLFTRLGSCDIDDVILNTLGGWIGCLIYKAIHKIRNGNR